MKVVFKAIKGNTFSRERLKEIISQAEELLKVFDEAEVINDTDDIETIIMKKYITERNALKVARWAKNSIAGFAYTVDEAQYRVERVLDCKSINIENRSIQVLCRLIRRDALQRIGTQYY